MITLTKTMLDKSIIDCNAACREVALSCGVNFDKMAPGDRETVPAMFINGAGDNLEKSEVRFYRTNNARGDRRISIKGIKNHASAGDVVLLESVRGGVITLEITA